MPAHPKPWPPVILTDLGSLTTREFLAKHPDWTPIQVRNARSRAAITLPPEVQRRGRVEASAGQKLSDVGFTREMAETMSASQIAGQTGLRQVQVEKRRQAQGWHGTHPEPIVEFDEAIPEKFSWGAFDEMFSAIAAIKDVEKKYDPRRHRIGVKLKTDKPVGILFTSDWQLGSMGVAYADWRADMDRVWTYHEENPDALFAIGLGDYGSHLGVLDHGGSQNQDIVRSGDQYTMLQQFFKLTAGLWLVLLQGCHDTFISKKGAIDTVERYCELAGARHAWHGAQVDVTVGKEKYITRLRHKYRYNSSLNPANSQRREIEMEGPADVVAHGHLHTSFTHEGYAAGQDALMLRSGSYQHFDEFSRQQVGNVKSDARQPMIVLWPDQHKIWSCRDFRDGLDYLTSLRSHRT